MEAGGVKTKLKYLSAIKAIQLLHQPAHNRITPIAQFRRLSTLVDEDYRWQATEIWDSEHLHKRRTSHTSARINSWHLYLTTRLICISRYHSYAGKASSLELLPLPTIVRASPSSAHSAQRSSLTIRPSIPTPAPLSFPALSSYHNGTCISLPDIIIAQSKREAPSHKSNTRHIFKLDMIVMWIERTRHSIICQGAYQKR
jgi:hypothetical protein